MNKALIFSKFNRSFIPSFFLIAVFCLILSAGCGSDQNNIISVESEDPDEIYSIATDSYLPLQSSSILVYSNGEKVYESKYIGEVDAAGTRAVKFGSAEVYNLYNLDSDSINLCGDERASFDSPLTLCGRIANLYEENTSSVSIGGKTYSILSVFTGKENITTPAGTFDTIKFELTYKDGATGNIELRRVINLCKNVGIVADVQTSSSNARNETILIGGTTETNIYSRPVKKWAFLFYSCGHNPSNDISVELYDQLKQLSGGGLEKSAYIVAQLAPSNQVLNGVTTRFTVENGSLKTIKQISDRIVDTGRTDEIISFYKFAIDAFPAEHYALFISGHGSGAISFFYPDGKNSPAHSIAYDDSASNSLKLFELTEAYKAVTAKLGKKIDIIVYDSCVMQMFEVAYQLKDFADYFVASQANLAGEGIDLTEFSKFFNASTDFSALNVSKMLVNAYIDSKTITASERTLSVTDLSKASLVKSAIDKFADGIMDIKNDSDLSALIKAVNDSQNFGPPYFEGFTNNYIDLFDFSILIDRYIDSGPAREAARELINLENQKTFVVYNKTKGDRYKKADGISIFIPKSKSAWVNNNYNKEQYKNFLDFGRDCRWYEFIDSWGAMMQ